MSSAIDDRNHHGPALAQGFFFGCPRGVPRAALSGVRAGRSREGGGRACRLRTRARASPSRLVVRNIRAAAPEGADRFSCRTAVRRDAGLTGKLLRISRKHASELAWQFPLVSDRRSCATSRAGPGRAVAVTIPIQTMIPCETHPKASPGEAMDHYQVEKDIQHLEQIINHIAANDPLPLSYWRNRVQTVAAAAIVPAQRGRVNRLIEALEALEAR